MANILIKQGLEIAIPDFVITTDEARKVDLTSIIQTGTTSSQAISAGTYFYLNGTLVKAKVAIASGATFTLNTNYEVVTAGALNELKDAISGLIVTNTRTKTYTCPSIGSSVDVLFTLDIPTGYKCIGIINALTNTASVLCNAFIYNNNLSGALSITNIGQSAQAGQTRTAQWTEVYVKDFS